MDSYAVYPRGPGSVWATFPDQQSSCLYVARSMLSSAHYNRKAVQKLAGTLFDEATILTDEFRFRLRKAHVKEYTVWNTFNHTHCVIRVREKGSSEPWPERWEVHQIPARHLTFRQFRDSVSSQVAEVQAINVTIQVYNSAIKRAQKFVEARSAAIRKMDHYTLIGATVDDTATLKEAAEVKQLGVKMRALLHKLAIID